MFIILAILIGIVIGLIRGGKLSGLTLGEVSLWPVGMVGIILQLVLHLAFSFSVSVLGSIAPILNFISYILILITFVFNLDDFWSILMAVGLTANFVVSFINGGKMPVAQSIVTTLGSCSLATSITQDTNAVYALLSNETTAFWFLGINIPIPFIGALPQFYGGVPGFSVGSILVFIGLIGYVQYLMVNGANAMPFLRDMAADERGAIAPPSVMDGLLPENNSKGENEMDTSWLDDETDSKQLFENSRPNLFEQTRTLFAEDNDESGSFFKSGPIAREQAAAPEAGPLFDEDDADVITQVMSTKELEDALKEEGLKDDVRPDDTRVFTSIKELGSYDTKPVSHHVDTETEQDDEDDFADTGFFTQSFYAEKGKQAFPDGEEADMSEEEELDDVREAVPRAVPKEAAVKPDTDVDDTTNIKDLRLFNRALENRKTEVKAAAVVEKNKPALAQDRKEKSGKKAYGTDSKRINPYRKYSNEEQAMKDDESRKNEQEMMDIWHQVTLENKEKRQKGRKRHSDFKEAASPFQAENERRVQMKQTAKETLKERRRAEIEEAVAAQRSTPAARQRNHVAEKPEPVVSQREAAPAAPAASSGSAQSTMRRTTTDEERERAGFEKVEINVEGRTVAFWRKKKQN